MYKRFFNKVLKRELLSYGFVKSGTLDYSKECCDGTSKIILRAPDMVNGFGMGVQFKDLGEFDGKSTHMCMTYPTFSSVLCSAARKEYTEAEIVNAIKLIMAEIEVYINEGKSAIRARIDQWSFGISNERRKNEIYAYFGMPLLDPYSEKYIKKHIEDWLEQGGCTMLTLDEYLKHEDCYRKYIEYGCKVDIGSEYVTIFRH